MKKNRLSKLWNALNANPLQIDAFLVSNPKNIFYLSSFTGEGLLLLTRESNFLITDPRYTEQAKIETVNCEIITQDIKEPDSQIILIYQLSLGYKIKTLGFESASMTFKDFQKYEKILANIALYPFENIIEKIRVIKDSTEIEILKKSCEIATKSFLQTISSIKGNDSELSVAALLNYKMRKNGAFKESFDLIVTSGERGLLIHGQPSEKIIKDNELVIIDFGCILEMYCSDCTRSFIKGTPNDKQQKIFDIIKKTQIDTLQKIKPGVKCSDLDIFARNIITTAGYGEYFGHSLGHGVGLDIHELPRLSPNDHTTLEPGMVVTVEPGIYVPGIGGVRIEDTVVITEKGCDILTLLPKEIRISSYLD